MRFRRKRRKKKRRPSYPQDRGEMSSPEKAYTDLHKDKGGPGNQTAIPGGLRGISIRPEETIAWLRAHCKFARTDNDESTDGRGVVHAPPAKVR